MNERMNKRLSDDEYYHSHTCRCVCSSIKNAAKEVEVDGATYVFLC